MLLAYEERAYNAASNRRTSNTQPTRTTDSPTTCVSKFEDPFFAVAEQWFDIQHIPVPDHLRSELVRYGTNFWRGGTQPQQLSLDAVRVMHLVRKDV